MEVVLTPQKRTVLARKRKKSAQAPAADYIARQKSALVRRHRQVIYLNDKEKASFYPALFSLMEQNFARMEEDITWLIDKFDYRNKDADWKNSKDALQRGMQKLRGGYPADPPHKAK